MTLIDRFLKNIKISLLASLMVGTTEHVFSFDQAMENVIDMLEVGGYYIGMIPSNNWNGHGLYQLSPMLYMQLFCKKNGMKLKHIYLCNAFCSRTIREIKKRDITNRTELNGFVPTELYIVARKVKDRDSALVLQQGDYEQKWSGNAHESTFVKSFKQFDDDKGVSLVMVNTEIGEKIWKLIQNNAEYFEISQEQCIQPNLEMPGQEGPGRKRFWHWYRKYGFKRTGQSKGYLPMNFVEKLLKFVYLCAEKGLSLLRF